MKQYRVVASLLLALGLTVLTHPALVQPAMAQAYDQRPCADDMAKFCGGVTPGGGRLLECYEQQKKNMSGQCISWAEYLKKNAGDLNAACSKEIDARCNSEKGDPLGMLNCLQSNYIDLSPKCVNKLNQFKNYYPMPVK
jgi:hypothetical protein